MKKYVMAFLKRGPNRDLPKEEADELQAAHMANIKQDGRSRKVGDGRPIFWRRRPARHLHF